MSKRKITYGLIFIIFAFSVFMRREEVIRGRQQEIATVASEWKEKGKPVITEKIFPEDVNVYSKITITLDEAGFGYAYVPKAVQEKIKPGQLVLGSDADGHPIGAVSAVAGDIDLNTGMYFVRIDLKRNALGNKIEDVVYVNTGVLRSVMCLPRETVRVDSGKEFVWIVKDNRARKNPVKIGTHNGYGAVIKSGLSKGDEVVLGGYTVLSENDKVHIINNRKEGKND